MVAQGYHNGASRPLKWAKLLVWLPKATLSSSPPVLLILPVLPVLPILPVLPNLPVISQLVAKGAGGRGEALRYIHVYTERDVWEKCTDDWD